MIHHQLCQDKAYQNLLKPHHNWRSWPLSTHFTDGRQGRAVTCLVRVSNRHGDSSSQVSAPHHQATTRDVTLFPQHENLGKTKEPLAHPDSSCCLYFRILPVLFMSALDLHCCMIFTAARMGYSVVVCGFLAVAPLIAEHRLYVNRLQ